MGKRYEEHVFTGLTTLYTSYDANKTVLGELIRQFTGPNPTDKWAGPLPIALARPMEVSTPFAAFYPHIVPWSSTIDWAFLVENSTGASATRRVHLFEYNKATGASPVWKGYITLTLNTATAHTQRGFRVIYKKYITGQASCAGAAAVAGNGTTWLASKMTVGSRIGFGSQDPTQIVTWYEISAVGGDAAITLTGNGPNTGGYVNYVIEDLKILVSTTNATVANGGLFLAKGLKYELFVPAGTTINAAAATDDVRAVYWLADAAVVLNTGACGVAIDDFDSWTQQFCYVLDMATAKVFKYNFRVALAGLAAGKSISAFVFATGNQAVNGTLQQNNNGRIGTLQHGPGAGVKSLYFVTTTRIYRAAVAGITNGSVNWQSDQMTEVPPGGVNTFAATAVMSHIEIADSYDRLIVISSGAAGVRSYVTSYNVIGSQMDHIFLIDNKQLNQGVADAGLPVFPTINAIAFTVWSEGGICYFCRTGTTALTNILFVVPLGAHWTYAGSAPVQRLITPSIPTPSCVKFKRVAANEAEGLGSDALMVPTEPFRVYYRTSGINDNTGGWTLVDPTGDLSAAGGVDAIQFMFEFRLIGIIGVPTRIYNLTVTYEDNLETDSHYEPSLAKTVIASRIFGYRQKTAWGSNIPKMRIRLYNAATWVLQLDDDTDTHGLGTFEYSTDGVAWNPWDNTKDQVGNFIRYTAAALADGIIVRALLTLG
jgi:hypothetical protein